MNAAYCAAVPVRYSQIMPFEYIKRMLSASESEPAAPEDARSAIAAILVMAARADDEYADAEKAMIDTVLKARFGLSAEETAQLREEGEAAESESDDHYQFTKAIRQAVPLEDRTAIVEALWRVILADTDKDEMEDSLMRQLADRLGLSPVESALARQKVLAEG